MDTGTLTTNPIPTDNVEAAAAALAASNESPALFPLDQQLFEIAVNTRPEEETPRFVFHTLRRPTEAELIARNETQIVETTITAKGEYTMPEANDAPDLSLWEKIVQEVKGYKLADGRPATEPRSITPQLVQKIPASHKLAALRGLYASECDVIADDDDGFDLERDTITVKQRIGTKETPDFVVHHILTVPTESERTKFERNRKERRTIGKKKGAKMLYIEKLAPYIAFYNDHFVCINGATLNGAHFVDNTQRTAFLAAIDAQYKRQVVEALMRSYEAGLQD